MNWNYRVIKYDDADEVFFQIHEVYYNEDNEIEAYTEEPMVPFGETQEELIAELEMMINDAKKYPALSKKELEEKFPS